MDAEEKEKIRLANEEARKILLSTGSKRAGSMNFAAYGCYMLLLIGTVALTVYYLYTQPVELTQVNLYGFELSLFLGGVAVVFRDVQARSQSHDLNRLMKRLGESLADMNFTDGNIRETVGKFEWRSKKWNVVALMVGIAMAVNECVNIFLGGNFDPYRIGIYLCSIAAVACGFLWSSSSLKATLLQEKANLKIEAVVKEIKDDAFVMPEDESASEPDPEWWKEDE